MKTAREGLSCTELDGNILAIGGAVNGRSVERFNTEQNTWSPLTSLPVDMYLGQAGTLTNNLVYAMDRNSGNVYTSDNLLTWNETEISNFNSERRETFPAPLVTASLINC